MIRRRFRRQDDVAMEPLGVDHADTRMAPFPAQMRMRRRVGVHDAVEGVCGVIGSSRRHGDAGIVNRVGPGKRELVMRSRGGRGRGRELSISGACGNCSDRRGDVIDGALLYVVDRALLQLSIRENVIAVLIGLVIIVRSAVTRGVDVYGKRR